MDYFPIDGDHLGFYIADVSGHGVSSAFVTVMLKSYIGRYRELHRQNRDRGILNPAETLSRLNREVFSCHMDKYLTIFYGVIDWGANRLRYSSGGQFPFPILFDGEQAAYLGKKSLPIGLFDFASYKTESLQLPPAFALVLISDGKENSGSVARAAWQARQLGIPIDTYPLAGRAQPRMPLTGNFWIGVLNG